MQEQLERHMVFMASEMDFCIGNIVRISENFSQDLKSFSSSVNSDQLPTIIGATMIPDLYKNLGRLYSDRTTLRRLMSITHGKMALDKFDSLLRETLDSPRNPLDIRLRKFQIKKARENAVSNPCKNHWRWAHRRDHVSWRCDWFSVDPKGMVFCVQHPSVCIQGAAQVQVV